MPLLHFWLESCLAFLLLTKVNIGVYTMLAVGLAVSAGTSGAIAVGLQQAIGAIMIALPVVFIYSRIPSSFWSVPHICLLGILTLAVFAPLLLRGRGRVRGFIAAAVCAAISLVVFQSANLYDFHLGILLALSAYCVVLIARADRPDMELGYKEWLLGLLGCGMTIVAILVIMILDGTSPHGLMRGLFWVPAQQSTVFTVSHSLSDAHVPLVALAGLGTCYWYVWARAPFADRPWFHNTLAISKAVFALWCSLNM